MATTNMDSGKYSSHFSVSYYRNGSVSSSGQIVGASSSERCIVRYAFNTLDVNNGCGGSSMFFAIGSGDASGTVESGELVAVLTTSPDAYKNKCADDISDALIKVPMNRDVYSGLNYGFRCDIAYDFLPNTAYYIFVVPKSMGVGQAYAHKGYRTLRMNDVAASCDVILHKSDGISEVTGAGRYKIGSTVAVSAVTEEGYDFQMWNGTYTSTNTTFSFTMPASDVILTAVTDVRKFDLTVGVFIETDYIESSDESDATPRFEVYLNGTLAYHAEGSFGISDISYGTLYEVREVYAPDNYTLAYATNISGILTEDTEAECRYGMLVPPEVLNISPPKFSRKVRLEWLCSEEAQSVILDYVGYQVQYAVSSDGVAWSEWQSDDSLIADMENNYLYHTVNDDAKYVKYRIRSIAMYGDTEHYSRTWTYCIPEYAEKGSFINMYDGSGFVTLAPCIYVDGAFSNVLPYVYDGTKWSQ